MCIFYVCVLYIVSMLRVRDAVISKCVCLSVCVCVRCICLSVSVCMCMYGYVCAECMPVRDSQAKKIPSPVSYGLP